jgi:hypothetical protein
MQFGDGAQCVNPLSIHNLGKLRRGKKQASDAKLQLSQLRPWEAPLSEFIWIQHLGTLRIENLSWHKMRLWDDPQYNLRPDFLWHHKLDSLAP